METDGERGDGKGAAGEADIADLIRRVRRGDAHAAEELVRHYEPMIRLKIRTWLRLRRPELRRAFDSIDICQSVMGNFFVRVAAGQYDLDDPGQVVGLLTVMARNRLSEEVRRQQSQRRDVRRTRQIEEEGSAMPARADTPSQIAMARDLLRQFHQGLDDEERKLAEMRTEGQGWAAIASALGGTPEGRRKQWSRAVDRMARVLGLEGDEADAL